VVIVKPPDLFFGFVAVATDKDRAHGDKFLFFVSKDLARDENKIYQKGPLKSSQ
jgi:hypothetical protein